MTSIRHRVGKQRIVWQVRYRLGDVEKSKSFFEDAHAREFGRMVDDLGAAEAERILAARKEAKTTAPLAVWCRQHIDTLSGVQQGTKDRYRRIVDTKLGRLGKMPVDAITADDVAAWVNSLAETGLQGKTIANYHGVVASALKAAVRKRMIPANPADGTRLPRTQREEMVVLSPAEFETFLRFVRRDARDMVTVLPWTGLRFGEVTALRVRDVNLGVGTVSVIQAWKYVEKGAPVIGPPKSKKSRRTIRVPRQALAALEKAMEGKAPDDLLFTNSVGKPWTRSRFHEGIWQPAVRAANDKASFKKKDKKAGRKPLGKRPRVHDMRHSCASWLLSAGADMYTVQRYLGHESFTTTEGTYAHLDPVRMSRAADALSALGLPQIEP